MPIKTNHEFRQAIWYLKENGFFGNIVTTVIVGNENEQEWIVLDESTNAIITPTQEELDTAYTNSFQAISDLETIKNQKKQDIADFKSIADSFDIGNTTHVTLLVKMIKNLMD